MFIIGWKKIVELLVYVGFKKTRSDKYELMDFFVYISKNCIYIQRTDYNLIHLVNNFDESFKYLNKEFKNEIRKKKILSLCGGGTI